MSRSGGPLAHPCNHVGRRQRAAAIGDLKLVCDATKKSVHQVHRICSLCAWAFLHAAPLHSRVHVLGIASLMLKMRISPGQRRHTHTLVPRLSNSERGRRRSGPICGENAETCECQSLEGACRRARIPTPLPSCRSGAHGEDEGGRHGAAGRAAQRSSAIAAGQKRAFGQGVAAGAVAPAAPPPSKISTFRQGDRCAVKSDTVSGTGVIQFVGEVASLGPGMWVGRASR